MENYPPDYVATPPPPPPRSHAALWATLFLLLVAILGVLVFFIGRNDGWWGVTTSARVPGVKGDTLSQAESSLRASGFRHFDPKYERDLLVPQGAVISTQPPAGQYAKFSSTIALKVSSGAPLAKVPNVANLQCSAADTKLTSAGF